MKKWYQSRVLWANILATVGVAIQTVTGKVWLAPELQISLLAILNVILRFDTDTEIK